jgi:hypothetical protein
MKDHEVINLDISAAHQFARDIGSPFQDARSEVTGKMMSADEVALMTLHQLRLKLGPCEVRHEI